VIVDAGQKIIVSLYGAATPMRAGGQFAGPLLSPLPRRRARTADAPYAGGVKRLVRTVAAGGVLAGLLAGCSGGDVPQVEVVEVVRSDVVEVVDAPGTIAARATSTVSAPADATVEAVLVEDGATVTKGQILVRLASPSAQARLRTAETAAANAAGARVAVPRADLRPLQAQVDAAAHDSFAAGRAAAAQLGDPELRRQAEAQVAEAEARYRAASAATAQAVEQVGAGLGSLEQALDALGASQRAQAAAAVTAARATVEALTVTAPLDGVVTLGGAPVAAGGDDLAGLVGSLPEGFQGQAELALGGGGGGPSTTSVGLAVGAPVSTGSPLLTVTDLSTLTVLAEVDETDVLLVQPGVTATVEVDAVPDATYRASVSSVDVAPTTSARGGVSYRVRLGLEPGVLGDGEAPAPLPGMSAVVDLQVRTAVRALAVPTSAVVRDGGDDVVFVVEDGTAVRRPVVVGAQGPDEVEVVRGVEAGERVVARDADRLSDGQPVDP
jgi:HlyD family secretion protein